MNNSGYFSVSDDKFEDLLQSAMPNKPPEEIIRTVTPWKKAMKRVLCGVALSTLTLNLFYLNYILPTIGIVLTVLGLRALRNENKWFKAYYAVSLTEMAYLLIRHILNTTVTANFIPEDIFLALNLTIPFIDLSLFCLSLYAVEKKSGITPRRGPMVTLIIWYTIVTLLAVIQFSGFILPLLIILGFIFIIVSLNKISKEIDEVGYNIENASVKVSDKAFTLVFIVLLVTGMACGYAFGGSYKMQWEAKEKNEHIQVAEIKENLISLGFPESILDDMSAEDILACEGATKVLVDTKQLPFNKGREDRTVKKYSGGTSTYIKNVYDVREMTVTGVCVCLTQESEGDGDWMLIHHFCWDINPGFYGTECIQLFPAYRNQHTNSYRYVAEPTGRVLYTKDGTDYVSSYHSLGSEIYTSDNVILGQQTNNDIFATFSLPDDGEKQRGYVMYSVEDNSEYSSIIDSWITYNHQQNFLQYPAKTAKDNVKTDLFSDSPAFIKQQRALQIADRELM